ncbi:PorT family protein [Bacteroidales bacterium OttesenSCG-928-I14]|nr:PorT family protein [Bacteroidales bacterium OttesenSCG-928-I14]
MKKVVILLVLVLSPFLLIKAQVKFGVEAGGLANYVLASNAEGKYKFSYKVGAFVDYGKFHNDNTIESGIYYVRKGVSLNGFLPQYADYIQKLDGSMDYIELVPVLFRFPILRLGETNKFSFLFGVFASYGFGGKATLWGNDSNNSLFSYQVDNVFKDQTFVFNDETYKFKKLNPFDWGAKVGLEYDLNKFKVRAQGAFSAINLSKYDKKISNSSLELSVGYTF